MVLWLDCSRFLGVLERSTGRGVVGGGGGGWGREGRRRRGAWHCLFLLATVSKKCWWEIKSVLDCLFC